MKSGPSFQFYAQDFLVDTLGWTDEEVGYYTRLLAIEWVNGPLPKNEQNLRKIWKKSPKKFQKLWQTLSTKFIENPSNSEELINVRLEKTRQEQIEFRLRQSESGRKGASKRWGQNQGAEADSNPIGDPNDNPNVNPNGQNIALQSSPSIKPPLPPFEREEFLQKVLDGEVRMYDYLQRYPEPELEVDAIEVVWALRKARNPNSTRDPQRHEIETIIQHWLGPEHIPKNDLIKAAQGGDNDFDRKLLTVEYLLKRSNFNRLIAKYEDNIGAQEQAQVEAEEQRQELVESMPQNPAKLKDHPGMMAAKERLRVGNTV